MAGQCKDKGSIKRLFAVEKLPQHLVFFCCSLEPYKFQTTPAVVASNIIENVKKIVDAAVASKCGSD